MSKDVIMLLVEQLGMVLAYALNLRRSGLNEQALQSIDEFLEPLLNGNPDEADAPRMTEALSDLHLDGAAMLGIVRLLRERGDILANLRNTRCYDQYTKGLRLALTLPPDQWTHDADLINELYRQSDLDEPECIRLMDGMEANRRYAYAEDILFHILDTYPSAENRGRGMAFYDRLLALDDGTLKSGGLPRDEVLEGKAALGKG